MRKQFYVALALLIIIALIVLFFLPGGKSEAQDSKSKLASDVSTETVVKGNLSESVEVKGLLSLGQTHTYGTQLSGTVTSIAAPGTKIETGSEMMRVNDTPIVAMRGELPAWRAFRIGMSDGRDVMQLEENLHQLGYFTHKPDTHFDRQTASAIAKWKKDRGLDPNGTIELGRIVFTPSDLVVTTNKVVPGEPAGEQMIECAGTEKQVSAEIHPNSQKLLPKGAQVTVTLPDGKTTQGVVERVDKAIEKEDKKGEKLIRVPVKISLKDPAAAEQYLDATVGIQTKREIKQDVLSVPVRALLAEPGNKYAVEVVRGEKIERIPVELGEFADSRVEIRGGDLNEGDKVVVAE
ncbi:peptidoglycan-binding protein [Trueperella pyogenes]|uniref:efflux RND transporter periplasmic adaptor subunit n=1 Tax=Trueperella pyogenes TaxID=1661 RepID=UPI00345D581B